MYKRVFLDANILVDIYDKTRKTHIFSLNSILFLAHNSEVELFTSCDIITTIYYIESKHNKKEALEKILNINQTLNIIEFSNEEVKETCELMKSDSSYIDLEDTIQYILAKKVKCNLIISNDKRFISKDIELLTSKDFCKKFNL